MMSVERYFNWPPTIKVESKSSGRIQFPGTKEVDVKYFEKSLYSIGPLRLLRKAGKKLQIFNLFQPEQVVRTIEFLDDCKVMIDTMTGNPNDILLLDDITEILYEPWDMDRGSLLFKNPGGEQASLGALLKLATEGDPVAVITAVQQVEQRRVI